VAHDLCPDPNLNPQAARNPHTLPNRRPCDASPSTLSAFLERAYRRSTLSVVGATSPERDHDGDLVYASVFHYRYNVDYENVGGQFRIVETRGS
jgi:hypothetical protein